MSDNTNPQQYRKIFETDRCVVRTFIEDDIDNFMVYRNNLEWMAYQGFKGLSRDEYKKNLLTQQSLVNGAQFAIIRKSDMSLIGDVYMQNENDTFWIGYTINPTCKRQGFALEVVSSMILWIREQGSYKIMAGVEPNNIASIKLLEKLNFVYNGLEDDESIYVLH